METPATVGVEEEFLLADPDTGAPVPKNIEVARTAEDVGVELQLELTSCQVETSTGVHSDTAALLKELGKLRRDVAACAERNGARLLAVAVPPTVPDQYPITETPRYQRIAREFGMIAREQGLSGCHVHVAVPDREVAVQVSNHLRPWLPVYLAMTANSSIYRGSETGYASWRSILWRRWPSAGPPPYFDSLDDYESMVDMMLSSGSIMDRKMVYWDVRPSESFPTVEVRVSDVPATVAETALLATLVRATVLTALAAIEQGRPAPDVPAEVLRAAYWNAARSGLDGEGLDPLTRRVAPVRTLIAGLVDHTRSALDELGAYPFVADTLGELSQRGNGARRQLRALRTRGEITDVTAELATATLEGCQ
ncbi:glutamate--cysteine ligase [Nocardia sp. CS682]|uniref:glutamate--cysteine ligase 2 n=1 Tax=Nocardia sp. CS682 TaxID=1047172 RepID=UPI0010753CB9|nr:glutamate--cysteine ligase [Nocardia sp. CS682]QBS39222.1 carboxylate--amine ligase [Nocardia sp. CS682]